MITEGSCRARVRRGEEKEDSDNQTVAQVSNLSKAIGDLTEWHGSFKKGWARKEVELCPSHASVCFMLNSSPKARGQSGWHSKSNDPRLQLQKF